MPAGTIRLIFAVSSARKKNDERMKFSFWYEFVDSCTEWGKCKTVLTCFVRLHDVEVRVSSCPPFEQFIVLHPHDTYAHCRIA